MRRRIICAMIFFLLVIGLSHQLCATNILLYTRTQNNKSNNSKVYIRSMEDGVMNTFFEQGYIVFNALANEGAHGGSGEGTPGSASTGGAAGNNFWPNSNSYNLTYQERASLRLAKSGGAHFLIELNVTYGESVQDETKENNDGMINEINYTVVDVIAGKVLYQGMTSLEDIKKTRDMSNMEAVRKMGENIAARVTGLF